MMNTDRNLSMSGGADKEIILSDRMLSVADMVTRGNIVCDVGCDHGFVSIYLVQKGISPGAIAMDIRQGPLAAAIEHIKAYALTEYIETRLSDGVSSLTAGEADTLICAGMGGKLIKRILEEGKDKVRLMKELILQPQSEIRGVREYLRAGGYHIIAEDMVLEDGKYYPVIKAVFMGEVLSPEAECGDKAPESFLCVEDKYGPLLLKDKNPVLQGFLAKERLLCETILNGLKEPTGLEENDAGLQGIESETRQALEQEIKLKTSRRAETGVKQGEIQEIDQGRRRKIRREEIEDRIKDIDIALSYY